MENLNHFYADKVQRGELAGYASTYFWIDPKEDRVVIAMTQHVDDNVPAAGALRSEFPTLVYSALLER